MDPSLYHAFYEVEGRHWWFVGRRAVVDAFLSRTLGSPDAQASPERRILDVGCGTGGMLPMLARYGRVTGIDVEPLALEYCRKRGIDDVHLQSGFTPRGEFDVVTMFDVLEHVEDAAGCLATITGYLKPGGKLIVTVPAFPNLWSRHDVLNFHRRRYTRRLLVDALEAAGFRVRFVTHFNTLLFPIEALVRLFDDPKSKHGDRGDAEVLRPLRIGPLNGVLGAVFCSERILLRLGPMPFGLSLYAEAERRI